MNEKRDQDNQICVKHGPYSAQYSFADRVFFGSCPKCREESDRIKRAEESIAWHSKRKEIERSLAVKNSRIPERYRGATLDQIKEVCSEAGANKQAAQKYVEEFSANLEDGRCLILSGGVGTGKTHTACAIILALIDLGYRARYTRFPSMMREIKATYGEDQGSEAKAISEFTWPHLLVVDEIGIGYGTPYEENTFSDIMAERYDALKPTILISNLSFEAIERSIGDRNMSRMVDRGGAILSYTWESYRS